MNSVPKVADSAYAFLLVKYIQELGDPYRFLILGFKDILEDLSIHFKRICKGDFTVPTGKLEEISNLRKTLSSCLIALHWEDVGKYASWTTSFKILTESPLRRIGFGYRDISDPIDVMIWLSKRSDVLEQVLRFSSRELVGRPKPIKLEPLKNFLAVVRHHVERSRSYAEWFHPRKIIGATTFMLNAHELGEDTRFGHFLRRIGMESFSDFYEIPFFSDQTINEKTLQVYLNKYQQVLRSYLTVSYEKGTGKLRKSLSTLGLNLLRYLLVSAAESEIEEGKLGKWTGYFLEFEQGKREKRTRKRKYDINMYGARVMSRSLVSGFPTRIQFVLERSKDFGGDNILPRLFKNELKALLDKCEKASGSLGFDILKIKMPTADSLVLELRMQKKRLGELDTYVKGLKPPIRKINSLLSKIGVE